MQPLEDGTANRVRILIFNIWDSRKSRENWASVSFQLFRVFSNQRLGRSLLANEDAGSVVEGKKSEKLRTELQTGRRDQSTLAPKQLLRDEASQ